MMPEYSPSTITFLCLLSLVSALKPALLSDATPKYATQNKIFTASEKTQNSCSQSPLDVTVQVQINSENLPADVQTVTPVVLISHDDMNDIGFPSGVTNEHDKLRLKYIARELQEGGVNTNTYPVTASRIIRSLTEALRNDACDSEGSGCDMTSDIRVPWGRTWDKKLYVRTTNKYVTIFTVLIPSDSYFLVIDNVDLCSAAKKSDEYKFQLYRMDIDGSVDIIDDLASYGTASIEVKREDGGEIDTAGDDGNVDATLDASADAADQTNDDQNNGSGDKADGIADDSNSDGNADRGTTTDDSADESGVADNNGSDQNGSGDQTNADQSNSDQNGAGDQADGIVDGVVDSAGADGTRDNADTGSADNNADQSNTDQSNSDQTGAGDQADGIVDSSSSDNTADQTGPTTDESGAADNNSSDQNSSGDQTNADQSNADQTDGAQGSDANEHTDQSTDQSAGTDAPSAPADSVTDKFDEVDQSDNSAQTDESGVQDGGDQVADVADNGNAGGDNSATDNNAIDNIDEGHVGGGDDEGNTDATDDRHAAGSEEEEEPPVSDTAMDRTMPPRVEVPLPDSPPEPTQTPSPEEHAWDPNPWRNKFRVSAENVPSKEHSDVICIPMSLFVNENSYCWVELLDDSQMPVYSDDVSVAGTSTLGVLSGSDASFVFRPDNGEYGTAVLKFSVYNSNEVLFTIEKEITITKPASVGTCESIDGCDALQSPPANGVCGNDCNCLTEAACSTGKAAKRCKWSDAKCWRRTSVFGCGGAFQACSGGALLTDSGSCLCPSQYTCCKSGSNATECAGLVDSCVFAPQQCASQVTLDHSATLQLKSCNEKPDLFLTALGGNVTLAQGQNTHEELRGLYLQGVDHFAWQPDVNVTIISVEHPVRMMGCKGIITNNRFYVRADTVIDIPVECKSVFKVTDVTDIESNSALHINGKAVLGGSMLLGRASALVLSRDAEVNVTVTCDNCQNSEIRIMSNVLFNISYNSTANSTANTTANSTFPRVVLVASGNDDQSKAQLSGCGLVGATEAYSDTIIAIDHDCDVSNQRSFNERLSVKSGATLMITGVKPEFPMSDILGTGLFQLENGAKVVVTFDTTFRPDSDTVTMTILRYSNHEGISTYPLPPLNFDDVLYNAAFTLEASRAVVTLTRAGAAAPLDPPVNAVPIVPQAPEAPQAPIPTPLYTPVDSPVAPPVARNETVAFTPEDYDDVGDDDTDLAWIAAPIAGGALLLLVILGCVLYCYKRKRHPKETRQELPTQTTGTGQTQPYSPILRH